ncbi:hypothetical protein GGI25_005462 [Coemansia spiralis]|uniref:Zn(2)-C6 fungal-type domain-containing protein n=2 Tax=Coemansia TaxID=4863 RepID=A0A9W8G2M1_9FUNG|nr:hypothetical protein BX070DRAFT_109329 [Coemansia spiralis]KAJ1988228.1 hypothetical protein EDC05_005428 [Coemansia umbellata]KAJ2619623.1 hypothetical protein GGI26_005677 [Coemansia sp. RSA 1358]KAJ2671595.1 hypothetical protein GGI25_005462 [Coemansia spiralis]
MSAKETSTKQSASTDTTPKPARTGRGAKPHVPSACTNCKKAHLACDLQRPCRRCVNSGKCDTCQDVQHKKRGRPRSKDKKTPADSSEKSPMETQMFQFTFTSPSQATATATAPGSATQTQGCCASAPVPTTLSPPSSSASTLSQSSSPAPAPPVSKTTATTTTTKAAYAAANTFVAAPSAAIMTPAAMSQHGSLPPSPVLQDKSVAGYLAAGRANAPTLQPIMPADEPAVAPATSQPSASYLFLTPSLLCLRLEELLCSRTNSRLLLGHSLLSLINRNVMDFVSEHDMHSVLSVFESIRQQLSAQLAQSPSQVYSHAVLGHPPPAVDPNTFQALPIDRLLQRVCADVCGNVRAHMRTAAGCYDLFDIHVYVGAVSKPPLAVPSASSIAGLTIDEVYFVCRITKFDALSAATASYSSPLSTSATLPRIAMPPLGGATTRRAVLEINQQDTAATAYEHVTKRRRRTAETAKLPASPSALYLLATVTDSNTNSSRSNISDKQWNTSPRHSTTVSSSPTLATPSPSLTASLPPRVGALPPLSDLLKSLDSSKHQQQHHHGYCSPSPSLRAKNYFAL